MFRIFSRPTYVTAVAAALMLGIGAIAKDNDAPKDTAPKVVKFTQLIDTIKEHKGKVVVVDAWADT